MRPRPPKRRARCPRAAPGRSRPQEGAPCLGLGPPVRRRAALRAPPPPAHALPAHARCALCWASCLLPRPVPTAVASSPHLLPLRCRGDHQRGRRRRAQAGDAAHRAARRTLPHHQPGACWLPVAVCEGVFSCAMCCSVSAGWLVVVRWPSWGACRQVRLAAAAEPAAWRARLLGAHEWNEVRRPWPWPPEPWPALIPS